MVKIPSNQVFVQGQGSTSADNLNSFVQVCDTAARLATFTGLPNMMVDLLGITAPNDGGQGLFFYANGTGFVSDGFNVVVPNGVTTGAWLRLTVVAAGLSSNGPIIFSINGTEVGRFDQNGNFGVGTVPPSGTQIVVDVARNANQSEFIRLTNNSTGSAAGCGYLANNSSSGLQMQMLSVNYSYSNPLYRPDSAMIWSGGANGLTLVSAQAAPIVFASNNVEIARFDSIGHLGLGTTSPSYGIDLVSPTPINMRFQTGGNPGGVGFLYADNTKIEIGSLTAVPLTFGINGGQVGLFDTSGRFIVGGTAVQASFPAAITAQVNASPAITTNDTNAVAGSDNAVVFVRNASAVGSIVTTLTTTAFNTSSDKNLKTLDESRTLNSGDVIDGVSPHEFIWNQTGTPDFGFFAQELNAATGDTIPGAVSIGSPDEEFGTPEYRNWGVDLSKLVPVLWAEIQSLRKRVAQLEGVP